MLTSVFRDQERWRLRSKLENYWHCCLEIYDIHYHNRVYERNLPNSEKSSIGYMCLCLVSVQNLVTHYRTSTMHQSWKDAWGILLFHRERDCHGQNRSWFGGGAGCKNTRAALKFGVLLGEPGRMTYWPLAGWPLRVNLAECRILGMHHGSCWCCLWTKIDDQVWRDPQRERKAKQALGSAPRSARGRMTGK